MTIRDFYTAIQEAPALGLLVSTLVFLAGVLLVRRAAVRWVRERYDDEPEALRRLLVSVRNLTAALAVGGLVVIWAAELRTIAVSLLAVAVALTIGCKELIECLTGSFLRGVSKPFALGDRIEVAGHRGDVLDESFLHVKLLEVGPDELTHQRTGRTVTLPASLFLRNAVRNESALGRYVIHRLVVPLDRDKDDWEREERLLLGSANAVTTPYLDDVKRKMEALSRGEGIDAPRIDPHVLVQPGDSPGRINLVLRFPTPSHRKGRMADAVLRGYYAARRGGATSPPAS
ncbi:MAG: mechanosensitive ion channel [Candidatus Sumerlaeia bacterium]|nr:mechanosensitive ion channel [Candidatus Sumerlaeia bacterium]